MYFVLIKLSIVSLLANWYSLNYDIKYHIRCCLIPQKSKIFPNSWGGLDNSDFLFSKRATGGLFDYYDIVFKEKK